MTHTSIELLAPAGTIKNMRYAFAFGADAVYAGQPRYSLRVRNNDFQLENLKTGIDEAHALGKKFFVASNLLPHSSKLKRYLEHMQPVIDMRPDALIMADPGLMMMVRERWPEMPIHLSVQANTMNWAAVKFWQSVGVSRIILSRELSLDEVEEIRQQCPDIELEVFVHGALCMAHSGRCLLSGYFNHRDANQGSCTNSCRWEYGIEAASEDVSGDVIPIQVLNGMNAQPFADCGDVERHPLADQVYMLTESERPNDQMPIFEDEHGTYIMNSKDLRAVQHVERLVSIGVDSVKIEGRTKSYYYVARTTQVYRQAINDALAGRPFDESLLNQLDALANRGYTDGFYTRKRSSASQNYETGSSDSDVQRFIGEIVAYDEKSKLAEVMVKNKFAVGDCIELIDPKGNSTFILEAINDARTGNPMHEAPGSGYQVKIPVPVKPDPHALLTVNLPKK
ncbi:MAG: U32 family peptidase [Zetaproteobacteria bacterium CG12_big_fil_rev_8_21_14_0_65_55_1124]|nr:MAG: U32 family peptidase [Zetaproteobacteria bacterium CG1_02_55_237]PIS18954.1 MAG: U32 family peptidase [Zetaproteobacteria bacterium CG08_land_8_20_14_0_20_55_17]PIW42155.1 MAG: U32 family peptidase [Zetaproteobacteria bacterium CG12_big_fil_rev_8_21_14_0_65_55_1124]PIY54363.1 MAG: U32 family peptidase [Zetaproteobacteria bacterium CG_4_10_14_0_8_um_filter_55_43]PIZ38907.1 MAG: U32 family peptidase [Zetaproteobacteria bacterium CG_4_10_14_0_2_um_filter_55_20]PJB82857.1 MAG: U32 family p